MAFVWVSVPVEEVWPLCGCQSQWRCGLGVFHYQYRRHFLHVYLSEGGVASVFSSFNIGGVASVAAFQVVETWSVYLLS